MMKVTTKKIGYSFAYFILLVILWLLTDLENYELQFKALTVFSFVSLGLFFASRSGKAVSFTTFFVIFLYSYNCGQVWLKFFNYEFERTSFLITNYSLESINTAVLYFLAIMCFFQLFLLLFEGEEKGTNAISENDANIVNSSCYASLKQTTVIFYFVCLIVITYNDIRQIVSAILVGYADSYKLGRDNSIIYMMLNIFPLLVSIGMFTFDGWKRKFIMVHAVARSLIMMLLVGNRGMYIATICMVFMAQSVGTEGKKEKGHLFQTVILGLFLVIIAGYVSNIRNLTSDRMGIAEYLRSSNIICEVLQELGGTMVNTVLLVKNVPQKLNRGYGVSYIGAFIQFIPKLSSLFPELCKYNSIGALLNDGIFEKGSGMGGSFIGELYLNFGWFAILALPFFAKIANAIEKNIRIDNGSPLKKGISLYFAYAFFMYVRGNFSEFAVYTRYLCYFLIVYYIMENFIYKKRRI